MDARCSIPFLRLGEVDGLLGAEHCDPQRLRLLVKIDPLDQSALRVIDDAVAQLVKIRSAVGTKQSTGGVKGAEQDTREQAANKPGLSAGFKLNEFRLIVCHALLLSAKRIFPKSLQLPGERRVITIGPRPRAQEAVA